MYLCAQTSKATISKLLRPTSISKIRFLEAAGVQRCRKRCRVSLQIQKLKLMQMKDQQERMKSHMK